MKNPLRILLATLLGMIPLAGSAQTYADLEERVVEHELENGMRFLIFERPQAPLVSMVIMVKAGSVNEVTGNTGLAHFLEHLAFKGTKSIGTTNYRKERKALEQLDAAFQAYHQAKQQGADSLELTELYADFRKKQEQASKYVVQGEFSQVYERNGGSGLNAGTSYDYTAYYLTLPSNRFELWCGMESDRLIHPVFREFYKERDVILEERRMRTDNRPSGLFYEEFNSLCYKAHPYGDPVIGHFSEMKNLTRGDVREFYDTYYVPQHMSAAIVGDVDADQVIELVDAYFGRIPAKPDPPRVVTEEPPQPGIRKVKVNLGERARMMMQFHTVPEGHPDQIALDLLASVLGRGRTSRLYRSLVEKRELASYVYSYHYTRFQEGALRFSGGSMEGVAAAELEEALLVELKALEEEPITEKELDAAKARWKMNNYYYFSSNLGMAYSLAWEDQSPGGNWREMFSTIRKVEELTPEDLMEVAGRYIDPDKRSVGLMEVSDD